METRCARAESCICSSSFPSDTKVSAATKAAAGCATRIADAAETEAEAATAVKSRAEAEAEPEAEAEAEAEAEPEPEAEAEAEAEAQVDSGTPTPLGDVGGESDEELLDDDEVSSCKMRARVSSSISSEGWPSGK